MRTREEIEKDARRSEKAPTFVVLNYLDAIMETALDIRDLLQTTKEK